MSQHSIINHINYLFKQSNITNDFMAYNFPAGVQKVEIHTNDSDTTYTLTRDVEMSVIEKIIVLDTFLGELTSYVTVALGGVRKDITSFPVPLFCYARLTYNEEFNLATIDFFEKMT